MKTHSFWARPSSHAFPGGLPREMHLTSYLTWVSHIVRRLGVCLPFFLFRRLVRSCPPLATELLLSLLRERGPAPPEQGGMSSPRSVCWAMCSLVALHLTILTPGYAFAQDARVSVGFIPINGQPIKGSRETPLFTFELVDPVSRGAVSLPALSLTSTESGATVSSYMFAFPVLKLGRMSFNPRYGDQKFGVDFLAGSLSGMSLKPLRVQGFSLATAQGDNSFTLMLGQVRGKGSNALSSAVPRVLALTGTLKASPRSHNRPSSRHAPREAHTAWECRHQHWGKPTRRRFYACSASW